jgi:hypothetical protein
MVKEYVDIACSSGESDELVHNAAYDAVYSVQHLKRKLKFKHGNHIYFAEKLAK